MRFTADHHPIGHATGTLTAETARAISDHSRLTCRDLLTGSHQRPGHSASVRDHCAEIREGVSVAGQLPCAGPLVSIDSPSVGTSADGAEAAHVPRRVLQPLLVEHRGSWISISGLFV